jgi:hypothetical protein
MPACEPIEGDVMTAGTTTAVGAAIGAAFGAANGQLALSVAIGAAVGAVLEMAAHAVQFARRKRESSTGQQ